MEPPDDELGGIVAIGLVMLFAALAMVAELMCLVAIALVIGWCVSLFD